MKLQKRKNWTYDKLTDDSGKVWVVHKADVCAGQACAIHNPSDHAMKDMRMVLREDPFKYAMPERVCPHGIGHPDPDSVAWYAQRGTHGMGLHGCDGCCRGQHYGDADLSLHDNHIKFEFEDPNCIDCNPYGLSMEDIH